jgi:hypothetical protein
MRRNVAIIIAAVLLCAAAASAQPRLLRATAGSGGVRAAGATNVLTGTVGQAAGGRAAGDARIAGFGFWYRAGQGTDDAGEAPATAQSLELGQNYPNPFGPGSPSGASSTRLEFRLAAGGHTVLAVHDLMGQRRAVLVDETLEAGQYVAVLRVENLSSGVYLCRLVQGTRHAERRLLLLR